MRCLSTIVALVAILAVPALVSARQIFPGATWIERSPEQVGLDPAPIDRFIDAVGGDGVLVKDGYLVRKWGSYDSQSDWASAAKPVISTMLFFAIAEGKIESVDAPVRPVIESLLGRDLISKDRGITWRHLANMTSGYARGEAPGDAWAYNDVAIMLYTVLLFDGVFRSTPEQVAMSRLASLQFQDGSIFGSRSGHGICASPRDFARIGWLWLNGGKWEDVQLVPRSLFDRNMRPDVPSSLPRSSLPGEDYLGVGSIGGGADQIGHGPGIYGFNWWFNDYSPNGNLTWPDAPSDLIQANGHWNREIMSVIPSLNMVVACRGDWGDFEPGDATASMNDRLKLLGEAVRKAPLPGQIVVDPQNPAWLVRAGGGPVFLVGPGDPEGFLYRGRRIPDGTRDGDQAALIQRLIDHGGNTIYMQIVRSHGGDGPDDHNPFVDSDPSRGLTGKTLDQWESWFRLMDENGIVVFLFFYDDGARIWKTGDLIGPAEGAFIDAIVDRFEHHRNLIWVVGEESEERYSHARVRAIADRVRRADDHAHVIADHHRAGTVFKAWRKGAALEQFAMQVRGATPERLHDSCVKAWRRAGGRYNLVMSETADHGAGERMRRMNWACAMGGAYVMVLGMDIETTDPQDLAWCRIQQRFLESTDFHTMEPRDDLASHGTKWVLAREGQSAIAYSDASEGAMGVRGFGAGTYDLLWVDCVAGRTVAQTNLAASSGDWAWLRPAGIGPEAAVWIVRTGGWSGIP